MYNKSEFQRNNFETVTEFIQSYPLAFVYVTNTSTVHTQTVTSLLPILIRPNQKLLTHLARRNPLVEALKKNGGLLTLHFFGPQRYISPQIYQNSNNVPTWN